MKAMITVILTLLFLGTTFAREQKQRVWKDKRGRSITATYIGVGARKDTVVLKDEQGVERTLPISAFSSADQNALRSLQKMSTMTKSSDRTLFKLGSDPNAPKTGRAYRAVLSAERDRLKKELRVTPLYIYPSGVSTGSTRTESISGGEGVVVIENTKTINVGDSTPRRAATAERHMELQRRIAEIDQLLAADKARTK